LFNFETTENRKTLASEMGNILKHGEAAIAEQQKFSALLKMLRGVLT